MKDTHPRTSLNLHHHYTIDSLLACVVGLRVIYSSIVGRFCTPFCKFCITKKDICPLGFMCRLAYNRIDLECTYQKEHQEEAKFKATCRVYYNGIQRSLGSHGQEAVTFRR